MRVLAITNLYPNPLQPQRAPFNRQHLRQLAARQADGVVAVSRDLAGRGAALGADPRRVRVVYGGVDADAFCPGPADAARARLGLAGRDPLVLFVGNLVAVKGPDVLVAACARLA